MKMRLTALTLAALALAACDTGDDETIVGEPLPDTVPVAGTADALPEGMPLPPDEEIELEPGDLGEEGGLP